MSKGHWVAVFAAILMNFQVKNEGTAAASAVEETAEEADVEGSKQDDELEIEIKPDEKDLDDKEDENVAEVSQVGYLRPLQSRGRVAVSRESFKGPSLVQLCREFDSQSRQHRS